MEITSTTLSIYFLYYYYPFSLKLLLYSSSSFFLRSRRAVVSLHNYVVIKRLLSKSSRTVWCYSLANFDLECDLLNESDWNSMFSNASNVNQHWSSWQKRFLEIMEICIPKEGLPPKRISLGSLHHCLAQWRGELSFQIIQTHWLCQ